MIVDYNIPFYANTPDDTHCVQACYKMLLKYFQPDKNFSWEQLDKITAKQKDMWTWQMAGLVWLQNYGFDVVNIEEWDYPAFILKKKAYLIEKYGHEIADAQERHSNLDAEIKWAKKFIKKIPTELRLPNINDIKSYLEKGYLVIASVNYNSLHNTRGYTGHSVLIKGYDKTGLIIHDPGRPGEPNFHPSFEQFIKGWAYPDESAKNMTAIKLKDNGKAR